ncbi:MAG: type 1 glutamine amidotransferase family protein [Clostridium sp.]
MKKEILTFIFDGYADWESAYICSLLNSQETDYIIKTISFDKEPKKSMGGLNTIPDYSIYDYPEKFEMLLLIGGEAWMENKNNDIEPVVNYAFKNNIPIAAIFLGESGYLNDRKHTSNTLEFLKLKAPNYKGHANYIERQAVNDSGVITANGTATLEFAKEIMLHLQIRPGNKIDEWYLFHKNGFYKE